MASCMYMCYWEVLYCLLYVNHMCYWEVLYGLLYVHVDVLLGGTVWPPVCKSYVLLGGTVWPPDNFGMYMYVLLNT